MAAMVGLSTTRTPNARATPSTVTSSWVGPTPPLVKTTVCCAERFFTSAAMVSISSRMVTTRRNRMPSWLSIFASTSRFSSCTLPVKSSLPMSSSAALLGARLSAIELGLEGAGHRLTVGVDTEQLFDAAFGAIEPPLRYPCKADPLLEQPERSLEREITALELLDDMAEPANGVFERQLVDRRRCGTRFAVGCRVDVRRLAAI